MLWSRKLPRQTATPKGHLRLALLEALSARTKIWSRLTELSFAWRNVRRGRAPSKPDGALNCQSGEAGSRSVPSASI